jgi:hypothetical protein
VTAAEDFITTRRGGVGAAGRTRLAEARRHFQQAIGSAQRDPDAALTEAQYADALAQQARALSEQDVALLGDGAAGVAGAGIWGPGRAGLRGAILGGILVYGRPGCIGPGSFGGVDTRGRHSVGRKHSVGGEHSATSRV